MTKKTYDLIIVGGGPAGLTAALYASRRQLNTLVVAKSFGGQMALSHQIENYPGFDSISGFELAEKLKNQAAKWGAAFDSNEVKEIIREKNGFSLKTNKDRYLARAVVLAFGLTPRDLEVPGEEKLKGRGVSYCATCDGPFFRNKIVGVAGGGNSALEAAEYLSRMAKEVYLIHFEENLKAEASLLKQVRQLPNVKFFCCAAVQEIKGDKKLTGVTLKSVKPDNRTHELSLDGLFVEIGYQAKTAWLKNFLQLNPQGEIFTDKNGQTSVPGIFAAGDCSDVNYKQVVIAAGDGAKAALQAYRYLNDQTGRSKIPDWGKR